MVCQKRSAGSCAAFALLLLVSIPSALIADDANQEAPVMSVEVTLRPPEGGTRGYRKPYVAVWIQDKDGFPVKTLALWILKIQPGPRWYPDLRTWYRDEQVRRYVDDRSVIDAVSGATRGPGTYRFDWNGTNDQGEPVRPGSYTLLIESAREHGPYQLMKEPITLGQQPIEKTVVGNSDIEKVHFRYTGKLASK